MSKLLMKNIFLLLCIFMVYCGLRSHTFLAPFPHDEGLFLYAGQAWAGGELPYRDFWDHKPPGTFFYHSIPLRLFPFSVTALKFHECLWLSLSAFVLFLLSQKTFTRTTSWIVLVLYIFYTSAPHTIRTGGLTEENALFFIILAFYLILRKKNSQILNPLLAGICIGAAIQFRQTFVFESVFLYGAALHSIRQNQRKWFDIWKPWLLISIGMIIPEIIVSFYFLLHGAWYEYLEGSYLLNLFYVGPARAEKTLTEITSIQWTFIQSTGPYLLAPFFALTTLIWTPKHIRWMYIPLLLMFAGDAFAVSLSGEFYEHYYVQAAFSIHLLLALFIEGLHHGFKTKSIFVCIYCAVITYFSLSPLYGGIVQYNRDYHSILKQRSELESPYGFQRDAAKAVKHLTEANEKILLIGRDPNSIYILSGRYAGSRFYHYSPLWKEKLAGALTLRHKQDFLHDLDEKQPVLLLIDRRMERTLRSDDEFMSRIAGYLENHYTALEDIVDESPEDIWFWYGPRLTFLVRNERIEDVTSRFQKMKIPN